MTFKKYKILINEVYDMSMISLLFICNLFDKCKYCY